MRLFVSAAFAALLTASGSLAAGPATTDRQAVTGTMEAPLSSLVLVDEDAQPVVRRSSGLAVAQAREADRLVLAQADDASTQARPTLGGVKLDVGRDRTALGRLPSDPRQTYGEVGLSIDLGQSLSLSPSYRLNLTDAEDHGPPGAPEHALKVGASFKF